MRLKEYIEDGRKGQLAKRSGISREYLSRYIQGHSLPTPQQAEALAGNLDLRPYELYEEFELAFFGDTAREAKQAEKAAKPRRRKYTYNFSFRASRAFAKAVDRVMRLYGFRSYREMVQYMVDRLTKEKSPAPNASTETSETGDNPKTCI